MDFITRLPVTRRPSDYIWVAVNRLTKSTHLLPVSMRARLDVLAKLYVDEIVSLHGVPASIVLNRDPCFTSHFWESLQQALGTKFSFSTVYHPQMDGQTERTNQTLEDMLKACVLDYKENWEDCLPLCELAYNNNYHSSIKMTPFKALYGRRCKTLVCWEQVGVRSSTDHP